jgi:DNA polymerase elongation subunit (family B)
MKFKDLLKSDREYIIAAYRRPTPRREVQTELAEHFGVHRRTIRKWAKRLQVGVKKENVTNPSRILIYDIETPRLRGELWWSGQQYVNGNDIVDEPKIISISWKWYGDDKVHAAHWDLASQDDKEMMKEFLEHYNEADVVVGINNDRFDNRWINVRAAKHKLDVNTFVRSIDIQKQCKRLFRLPSYSLKYLGQFFDVPMQKQNHEGLIMWRKIQYGNMEERKEYMKKMIDYNVGDILATEALFMRLLPVLNLHSHLGVMYGNEPYSCPLCGETEDISLVKTTTTRAGTVQHVMQCNKDGVKYKLNNRQYLNWLQGK